MVMVTGTTISVRHPWLQVLLFSLLAKCLYFAEPEVCHL